MQVLTVCAVDVKCGVSVCDDNVSMIGVTGGSRVFHFLERRLSAHPVPLLALHRTRGRGAPRPCQKWVASVGEKRI